MKTPKDKAEELVNRFRIVLMNEDTECGNEILCTSIAIKNALIAVDEIIESSIYNAVWASQVPYYEEVERELRKL